MSLLGMFNQRWVSVGLAMVVCTATCSASFSVSLSASNTSAPPEEPAAPVGAENNAAENEISPALDRAVTNGLAALAAAQNPDGSWEGGARYGRHVGITGLAALAFMADGNLPDRGPYGDNVQRAIDFILNNVNETGLLAADTSHGPMYGHGFATLFLGEVYGMTGGGQDTAKAARLHEALIKAIRLIIQTQNPDGGWRYNPVPYDADISVTICQIMALRAARNAGIETPKSTIDHAVEYVRRCQNPDGGFKYQLTSGGSAWPRSAAGVASLYYAGVYQDDAIDRGLEYLFSVAKPGPRSRPGAHYFYGHYYAVQSMYLAGGERWRTWWPLIRDEIISRQTASGLWNDQHAGSSYGTAMALIILQMPKRYLPIFQK